MCKENNLLVIYNDADVGEAIGRMSKTQVTIIDDDYTLGSGVVPTMGKLYDYRCKESTLLVIYNNKLCV